MTFGVAIILIPNAPLIQITIWTQIINAVFLPLVLVSMVMMVNNKDIMGEHVNNLFQNVIAWTTTGILVLLSVTLLLCRFYRVFFISKINTKQRSFYEPNR